MLRPIRDCPVCGGELHVSELSCRSCGTSIRNAFDPCRFCCLMEEQSAFLSAFLRNRGNLTSTAAELGMSPPTAGRRLDGLLEALGLERRERGETSSAENRSLLQRRILEQLDRGEITAEEATRRIRELRSGRWSLPDKASGG